MFVRKQYWGRLQISETARFKETTVRNPHRFTFFTALLLGVAVWLSASTAASQSTQAIVRLQYKANFFAGTTFFDASGVGIATIGSTTPTPSVMWGPNIVSGMVTSTYSNTFIPFGSRMTTHMNGPGSLRRAHVGAAPTGAGSVVPRPTVGAGTTKCFASSTLTPTVMVGPPALPGSCFPRVGAMSRVGGSKQFGGTARMLNPGLSIGTIVAFSPTGYDLFSLHAYNATPALRGPQTVPGNYGILGWGLKTHTVLGTQKATMAHATEAPPTTGMATVTGADYATMITMTGSHNFNATNLTGMISTVAPIITPFFDRDAAGNFAGRAGSFSGVRGVKLTFLPEPSQPLMLASGVLFGLLGIAALKWR